MVMQEKLNRLIKLSGNNGNKVLIDLYLNNGNLILKSFELVNFDQQQLIITGLTMNEAYAHIREQREPVYCYFHLNEIKEINESQYSKILLPAIEI